jgi:hypothetical protein
MVRLFISSYPERRPDRENEYRFALERNVKCAAINEIFIFCEGPPPQLPPSSKLHLKQIRKRPTYDDFFAWINEVAREEDISIIANADISFDNTLAAAAITLGSRECCALTRWEDKKIFFRNDSQDSWIFRGRIRQVIAPFAVGVPRCDNRLMCELQTAGYRVLNPALTIVSTHHHAGYRTEYSETNEHNFVDPPYCYMWPHNLMGFASTLIYNLSHRDGRVRWRFDRRNAASSLPVRAMGKVLSQTTKLKNLTQRK